MISSIVKLTFVIVCILSFVTSHVINHREVSNEGVVVGPKTPVFNIKYPRPNFPKIIKTVNIFEASPAYNYYRNKKNCEGVFFISIMVVIDNIEFVNLPQRIIIKDILREWNYVDRLFGNLNTPKIKLVIAGVIIPEEKDIWGRLTRKVILRNNVRHGIIGYPIPSISENLKNWLIENNENFEKYHYDMFVYMTPYAFIKLDEPENKYYYHHSSEAKVCLLNTDSQIKTGGVVSTSKMNYGVSGARVIATTLGVPIDDKSTCGRYDIMDSEGVTLGFSWSKCSEVSFKNILMNPYYNCTLGVTYQVDDNDYDN